MDGARVAIFEDHEGIREILSLGLITNGHTVMLQAGSMNAARTALIDLTENDFDIAIVDGNLDGGTISGEDGAEITRIIRQKAANVAIIGFSASSPVEGADLDAGKDINGVINLITGL